MLTLLSILVFLISLILGLYGCMTWQTVGIIMILSLALLIIGMFSKPKYNGRKLLCSCELLPIVDNIYAIKTCQNKILCKYVDFEDENKVKIDIITIDCDIVKMLEWQSPKFYLYEQKIKNRWILLSNYPDIYTGVLSIPENGLLVE